MITTLQEVLNGLKRLNEEELDEVGRACYNQVEKLDYERKRKLEKSRAEIIKDFQGFGYEILDDAKFWKVMASGKGLGGYGMEIGRYNHSCHIDDTEFIVLLVVNGREHFTESYADIWLEGPI